MGEVWSAVVPLALVIGLSPLPALPMVVLVVASRGRAALFLAVFLVGLALLLVGTMAVASPVPAVEGADSEKSVAWVQLVVGLALIGVGVRKWLSRPQPGAPASPPAWLEKVAGMTPVGVIRLAALMAVANPKNLAMTIAVGLELALLHLPPAQVAGAGLLFLVVASLSTATPLVAALLMGRRAASVLPKWQEWLVTHNKLVMAVLMLVLGGGMVIKAIPAVG